MLLLLFMWFRRWFDKVHITIKKNKILNKTENLIIKKIKTTVFLTLNIRYLMFLFSKTNTKIFQTKIKKNIPPIKKNYLDIQLFTKSWLSVRSERRLH